MAEQRKKLQEDGYVDFSEETVGMSRLDFNTAYMTGIAVKRIDKHQRASSKLRGETPSQ